jgi:DnaK suppressor protein
VTDNITEHKRRLLSLLEELEKTDAAGANEQAIVQLDQQSVGRLNRIDALQRQQMAKEAARRRNLERVKIAAALRRIEDGEFGWCAECGEPIAPKRLEASLTAHLCLECAR